MLLLTHQDRDLEAEFSYAARAIHEGIGFCDDSTYTALTRDFFTRWPLRNGFRLLMTVVISRYSNGTVELLNATLMKERIILSNILDATGLF
jgi:hypothetical protein